MPDATPYAAAIDPAAVVEFPITAIDRLDLPVWTAATWEDGAFFGGVGYGATDLEARTSAWGELWESLAAWRHVRSATCERGSYADLRRDVGEDHIADPRTLTLPAGSPWTPDRELWWLPAERERDGAEVLVPVEYAASDPSDLPEGAPEPLITPITNGMGAAATRAGALGHGLREVLQRDGNSVSYRALDRGRAIALDDPGDELAALLERFDAAGIDVVAKRADAVPGALSVYVVGRDRDLARTPHPLALCACGEAADADPRRALRKALLEFAASRARRVFSHAPFSAFRHVLPAGYEEAVRARPHGAEEPRALRAMQEWLALDARGLLDVLEPTFAVREELPLAALAPEPEDPGLDVLHVPFTSAADGMQAGKTLVPGLEVETLSYGRIGPRNLERLLAAGERFVGRGTPPAGALALVLPEGHQPAWLHPGRLDERVGALYPLYREPGRHAAALRATAPG
jgi:ribosomal protein S12 methylthiotransferase accessory factor